MYIVIIVAAVMIALIALFLLAERLISFKHGDCDISLDKANIKNRLYFETVNKLYFSFDVSFINEGRQHALIMDCNSRLQPRGDIFRYCKAESRIINLDNIRFDDYWEGLVLKPGKLGNLRVLLSLESDDVSWLKGELKKLAVDVMFRFYGRGLMRFERTEFNFSFSDFEKSSDSLELTDMFKKPEPKSKDVPAVENISAIPVKTHILMPGEDIVDIIKNYVKDANKGDIFTIAESALAIIQSRVYYVDDIKPSGLAVKLSNFFEMDSSLSSPYSMQKAMEEVGSWRIILGVFAGMLGKLVGRKGDFYRVAGKAASVIDDCTGTLPPFDRYIVMGPADMPGELERIKRETGLEAAVVDVNDLRRVDILASTCPDRKELIEKALEYNPAGNASEQTPIVIIKAS